MLDIESMLISFSNHQDFEQRHHDVLINVI